MNYFNVFNFYLIFIYFLLDMVNTRGYIALNDEGKTKKQGRDKMKKNIMKKAWAIAKKGQAKFGGKVSEYFSESLKIAWRMSKMNIDTATKITVKNDKGLVELNKDGDNWYVTYQGKATSNYYDHEHVKSMIDNGDVYGEITYK